MKKVIYRNLYKLLSVISVKVDNRYINRYKIAIGSTLLILTGGCQATKRNTQTEESKDTVYAGSARVENNKIEEDILCYSSTVDTIIPATDPPPPIIVDIDTDDEPVIYCYMPIYEGDIIPPIDQENTIFEVVEKMPVFPGGDRELFQFIATHIEYPSHVDDSLRRGGRVIIEFVIEKDGNISDPQILRSTDSIMDSIALDVVSKLPAFEPGMQNGVPVRVKYVLPVFYNVQ